MRREGLRQQRLRLGKGDSSPSGAGGEYGKNLQIGMESLLLGQEQESFICLVAYKNMGKSVGPRYVHFMGQ